VVEALLDCGNFGCCREDGLMVLLGIVEGMQAFLELRFKLTSFGEMGIYTGQ
jgi:hypothetical protein